MAEDGHLARLTTRIKTRLTIRNVLLREALSEFLGTFVLMTFGNASVAQYVLFDNNLGTYLSVNLAWGLSVAMAVWVSGGVSGGHINPAVSLALTVFGRLSWIKCLVYIAAQYAGSILASAVVYTMYLDALNNFDNGTRTMASAGIWATYPQEFLTYGVGMVDQLVGTGFLMLCVLAITDKNNMAAPAGVAPLCIGLIVACIGMAFGANCGYAINPARDLGPRLFTAMAGWGAEPFRKRHWWWIPILGPHLGAILGGWAYFLCVGIHAEAAVIKAGEEEGEMVEMNEKEQSAEPIKDAEKA